MIKKYKKSDPNFKNILKELEERFKGRGGDPDAETHVSNNKLDMKDGFVWFGSDNCDVANLIKRSAKYILEVHDGEFNVHFKMSRDGFRSCVHAFKVGHEK